MHSILGHFEYMFCNLQFDPVLSKIVGRKMTRILAATLLRPIIGNTYQPLASAHRLFTKSSVNCDHYDTLKIPRNATQSEIVSAYKQLTDVIKAERNADNAAETYSKLRKIEAAYNVLSNYELRKLYNKGLCFSLEC